LKNVLLLICGAAVLAVGVAACNEKSTTEPVNTQPSELPPPALPTLTVPESLPQPILDTQPSPESQPATSRPAKPESTYSSEPPYPVSLFVESPDDKQPGWLKIEKLAEDEKLATAKGRFPEQNRIYVDTTNVRRIRIHVGHLPLAPKERLILQIDKQGMVLSRRNPYVTLDRLPTGEWVVQKQKK
jgi:hypothetical protein